MFRRRPLARAAVVGGTAYVAGKAGAKAGCSQAAEQQQPAQDLRPSSQQAPRPQRRRLPRTRWSSSRSSPRSTSQGVLTDAEFEIQKTKILQSM